MQETDPINENFLVDTATGAGDATRRLCERVKAERAQRSWTLAQLAERSGVSRSMLSQVERGEANPTFAVAYRIAQAFGLSLGALVDEEEHGPRIEVVRAADRPLDEVDDEKVVRGLHPLHLERSVECYELRLQAGGDFPSEAHLPGTREFLTVTKGRMRITVAGDTQELAAGDSAYYPADGTHTITNAGRGEAVGFLVAVYQGR